MLNYLWSFMILAGLLFGAVCGNLGEVTQGLIESAQDAVALGITMLGMMTFWCGIMELIDSCLELWIFCDVVVFEYLFVMCCCCYREVSCLCIPVCLC